MTSYPADLGRLLRIIMNQLNFKLRTSVLGLLLAGLATLVAEPVMAHVGQSSPARWLLRVEQTMKNGRPETKKVVSWKVPLATFNHRYDESQTNALAQPITSHQLPAGGFTPLALEIPSRYSAVCMRGMTLTLNSATTGMMCDASGVLQAYAAADGTDAMAARNALFGVYGSAGMQGYMAGSCVSVNVQAAPECGLAAFAAPADSWTSVWGDGLAIGDAPPSAAPATPIVPGATCSVTVSGPGVGTAAFTVDAAQLQAGQTVNLGDMWYYGNVPYVGNKFICQAGAQGASCGAAGSPTACGYFGMADAVAKGVNFPLTRDDIVEQSRANMGLLQGESYGWMWGAMRKEQLMNGYFTHIMQDINLVTATNNTNDIGRWSTEPAEAQWTMYADNTPSGSVNQAGRNSQGTYGDVLIRRYTPVVKAEEVQIASGQQLVCRYNSRSAVHVVPQWVMAKTGYLQCALYSPPTQTQVAAGITTGTMIKPNIFEDANNPDSVYGMNLQNQYDDLSNDDEQFCEASPTLCVAPFEANGGGTRLIKNVIRPLLGQWDAQSATLLYGGAPTFTALNRLPADGVGGKVLWTTMTAGVGSANKLVTYVDAAGSSNLMMLGQSFRIQSRNVNFGTCGAPITMSQTWTWDGTNGIPEYNWDIYTVSIPIEGGFQVVNAFNTGDGSLSEGNGIPATTAQDVATYRKDIPVPLAVALSIPAGWKSWLSESWTKPIAAGSILADSDVSIPSSSTTWRAMNFPSGVHYMVEPGPAKHEGPYFVLNPLHYTTAHPGYYSVIDAHTFDGRDPMNASSLPDTLSHTFRDAPENGTVTGALLQYSKTLKCETKGTSQCCVEWTTPAPVCDASGKNCKQAPPYCSKFSDPYETCATYSCNTSYCDWNMAESKGGTMLKWKEQDSCSGWSELQQAIADYAANLCVLPYTWNGAMSPTYNGGNNPADYFQVKGEALKYN